MTWYVGGRQRLGVEVERGGQAEEQVEVYIGGTKIGPSPGPHSNRYEVLSIERVTMVVGGETRHVDLAQILLFKQHDRNAGRLVARLSNGTYLVLAPSDSSLDVECSTVPAMVKGYSARQFAFHEGSSPPVVTLAGGETYPLRKASSFGLSSPCFSNPGDERGFYLGQPPTVLLGEPAKPGTGIVVGEEIRSGKRPWRAHVVLPSGVTEYPLASLMQESTGGWFYVRMYENDDVLIDSDQFVYVRDATAIRITGCSVLPDAEGHREVEVETVHGPAVRVTADDLDVDCEDGCSRIRVPPDPECDLVRLQIHHGKSKPIRSTLSLARLWFRIGGDAPAARGEWCDHPLSLQWDAFKPSAGKRLSFKLPPDMAGSALCLGFSRDSAREYPVKKASRVLMIPLSDFYADPQVQKPGPEPAALRIWAGSGPGSAVVARVERVVSSVTRSAWGRSKNVRANAVTRFPGGGGLVCDGYDLDERNATVDCGSGLLRKIQSDAAVGLLLARCDITVKTYGGAPCSVRRSKAAAHAIARALVLVEPGLKDHLRAMGLGGARLPHEGQSQSVAPREEVSTYGPGGARGRDR